MNAKISVFVICVEAIILLLYNLHDCILMRLRWFYLLLNDFSVLKFD